MMKFYNFSAQSASFIGLLACSFAVASPALPEAAKQWKFTEIPSSTNLLWYPCFDGFFCAMLDVPLDYKKPEGLRASVPIIKYPATTKPYKGMVLTNPGGPGERGVHHLLRTAEKTSKWIGTNYDYVSWDPRGLGYSVPAANCVDPLPARGLIPKLKGPEIPLLMTPADVAFSISMGDLCKKAIGGQDQAGPHMTTAIVSRDIISILDAFAKTKEGQSVKDSSLLNYWGISYGTFLGQTFASMFPHRVGRLVLDAVVKPDDFSRGIWSSSVIDADKGFSSFFLYCHHAGSSKCAFNTGETPNHIYQRFQSILAKLDPKLAGSDNQTYANVLIEGLQQLKTFLYAATYDSKNGFPWVADILVSLETVVAQGLTSESLMNWSFSSMISSPIFGDGDINQRFWNLGVECSDADKQFLGINATSTIIATIEPLIKKLSKQSYLGDSIIGSHYVGCVGWQIRSNDVFKGPFGGKTKNPILFVSTTLDPVTPLANAQNGARIFQKAELLTVEAVGHSVHKIENQCGLKKINAYFQTGRLPGHRNFCPLEPGPWGVTLKSLKKRTFDLTKN